MITVNKVRVCLKEQEVIASNVALFDRRKRVFEGPEEVERFRERLRRRFQFKQDSSYQKQNPDATAENINENAPKIEILLETNSPDGYVQKSGTKKA